MLCKYETVSVGLADNAQQVLLAVAELLGVFGVDGMFWGPSGDVIVRGISESKN